MLDVSGSMNDDFGGRGSPSKISALKTAVNSFLDETAKTNDTIEDDNNKVKVALVKYANQIGTATGADGCRISNSRQSDTGNCTQIVQELTTDAGLLKTSVNGLQAAGATYADAAMEVAQQALAGGRAGAKKYVIFFTDGEPNHWSGFDGDVANAAIKKSQELKNAGTTVYSIGIFRWRESVGERIVRQQRQ